MNIHDLSVRSGIKPILLVLFAILVFLSLSYVGKYRMFRRLVKQDSVILELTPPPSPHNTTEATEEFFTVLRQVVSLRTWRDMMAGHKTAIALEVVSTHAHGIRYLVRLPRKDREVFQHTLAALAPTVSAIETTDYLSADTSDQPSRVLTLRQTGPKMHSLRISQREGATDPIAYLTNAMCRLEADEYMAIQLVLMPTPDWQGSRVKAHEPEATHDGIIPASLLKGRQPLFHAALRIALRTQQPHTEQRVKGIVSALSAYSYEGFQSLQPRLELGGVFRRTQLYAFSHRLPHISM